MSIIHDPELARRILNKANKSLVEAFSHSNQSEVRYEIQRAMNDLTFMYDVLHLDKIEVINIENK